MKICDKCGAENLEHSKFCLKCGSGLQSAESAQDNADHGSSDTGKTSDQCPRCRETHEAGEKFCANCGFRLDQPYTEPDTKQRDDDEAKLTEDAEAEQETSAGAVSGTAKQTPHGMPADSQSGTEKQTPQDDTVQETAADPDVASNKKTDESLVSELTSASPAAADSEQADEAMSEPGEADIPKPVTGQGPQHDENTRTDGPSAGTDPLSGQYQAPENTQVPVRKFCPRCGQPVVKDAAFCRNCGNNLKKSSDTAYTGAAGAAAFNQSAAESGQPGSYASGAQRSSSVPYPAPSPQGSQTTGGYPQSYVQPGAAYQPPGYQPPGYQPPQQKTRKKKGLIAVIILLVIVLGGAATYLLAGPAIRRMIMGNKAAYLAIEGQQLKQNAEDLSGWMADMGNKNERPEAGGHRMTMRFDLPDYESVIDPVLQSTLENITWHTRLMYDQTSIPSRYYAGIDLMTGSEPLISIEGYYDEEQIILGVPSLLSRYVRIQRDMVDEYGDELGLDTAEADDVLRALDIYMNMDLGIHEARLAGSMYRIIDIMLEHIDDVEYSAGEELVVGPVRQSYNRYTMTLGHESARQMMIELLTFIRDDPEIYNLVSGLMSLNIASDPYYAEMGITFTRDEFQAEIDLMLEDLADDEDIEPFTIINDIYVDGSDQIFGRYFRIVPENGPALFEYKNYRPQSGSQSAVLISVNAEGDALQYQNIYELSGELKTGEIVISQNNQVLLNADFSDYQKVTIGSRDYHLGDFRFTVFEDHVETAVLEYSAARNGSEVQMQFGMPEFGRMTVGYEEIAEQDLSFPDFTGDQLINITDYEALGALMTEETMMELFRIMQQLGISMEDF